MLKLITALVVAVFALGSLTSPLYSQATKEPAKKDAAASKKAPLDLNTASEDELKALLGR